MLRDPDFQTLLQNPKALSEFAALLTGEAPVIFPEKRPLPADVDGNGVVNILDLVRIAARLGRTGPDPADVNRDGTVNIRDIVLAAALMGTEAAAPSAGMGVGGSRLPLRAEDIQLWLTQAQHIDAAGSNLPQRGDRPKAPDGNVDTEKDRTPAQLSEPVQSRDMDTLSTRRSSRCYAYYLFSRWTFDSHVVVRASICGCVSGQKPCGVLGRQKRTR